jgi:phospholipase D1/2
MMSNLPPLKKSLNQIIDKNGKPCQATATETLWVGYANQEFASVTTGNAAVPYTTGKKYLAAVKTAIEEAEEEILITGWQINWDALLAEGVRLFDVLLAAAKKQHNPQIYIMPWDDTAPVQTFDDQTTHVMRLIRQLSGKACVHVLLAGSLADESPAFFSHHQKQVVIDRKIAFVGGIDLAYGRYDDATYDLHANAAGREVLNRYNGCIAQVGTVAKDTVVDPDLLSGLNDVIGIVHASNRNTVAQKILGGAWQTPYQEDSPMQEKSGGSNLKPVYVTINEKTQPRMPWQDVHCRIEGPAVSDLARNFILRWNGQGGSPHLKAAKPASAYPHPGNCQIQVLRSAPKGLRTAEYKVLPYAERNRLGAPATAQNDIVRAMQNLILRAQHFIYIENQFFVSDFGAPQGFESGSPSRPVQEASKVKWGFDQTTTAYISTTFVAGDRHTDTKLPQNQICATIAKRIDIAIRDKRKHPFHVIITLPVHSEGALNSGPIMTQVHWTMQSLVFGSHSLLNRIRRSIKAQQLRDKKEPNPERVHQLGNQEYEDVPIEECFKYVTLLNLRNWEELGDRYVTEQVYVHSKVMIVDDLYAILGSANINDRSLLGTRDSELAVLITDNQIERTDICGNGKALPVRGFAHQLRREIWSKIFGLTGKVRPATELTHAVEHPGDPKSWKAIQKVAKANAHAYEAAFDFIPRNKDPNDKDRQRSASIWPIWNIGSGLERKLMPFEAAFWTAPQHSPSAAEQLPHVKGFITTLPIEWTKGENNNVGFHTALVVHNNLPQDAVPMQQQNRVLSAQRSTATSHDDEELST